MIESKYYTPEFFKERQDGSYISAQKILPLVKAIFNPRSVIDIGCGPGYWLKVWKEELGVDDVLGIEGPYVSADMLKVPAGIIRFQDLKEPFNLDKKYDLAMSLEVAEHLPVTQAEKFIDSITQASDIVLFSAAIPGQEGAYHINEQVPEYWAKIFARAGYVPVDYLRPKVWNDESIEWWYRQNVLIYIRKELLNDYPLLADACKATSPDYLLRIQPWLLFYKHNHILKTRSIFGYIHWKLYLLKKFLLKNRK